MSNDDVPSRFPQATFTTRRSTYRVFDFSALRTYRLRKARSVILLTHRPTDSGPGKVVFCVTPCQAEAEVGSCDAIHYETRS